jgi:hypothetical protein
VPLAAVDPLVEADRDPDELLPPPTLLPLLLTEVVAPEFEVDPLPEVELETVVCATAGTDNIASTTASDA